MNESHFTDAQLDRLVDGELPDHEYRRLLASLDDEPGGWRRCALAFVEAQALQRDLGELAELGQPYCEDARTIPARPSGDRRRWPLLLAMAGSFLLAFTLGMYFSGPWRGSTPPLADGPPDIAENVPDGELAGGVDDSAAAVRPEPEQWPTIDDRGPAYEEATPPSEPEGVMTLVFEDADNEMRRVELPYYRYDERQAVRWPTEGPEPPIDLIRALRRTGHDLRQRRQFVPIDLDDGSRVVFPMDEVEIVPVGGHGYQ